MRARLLLAFFMFCYVFVLHAQTNRYWVGASLYTNSLTSSGDLSSWTLTNDNGTGSWTTSGTGSSILKVDNAAGGNANQLNSTTTGGAPRLLMLDPYDGAVELQVVSISAGTQFSIKVEEYDATATLVADTEILPWQSNAGFYRINLGDYPFDPSSTTIRFIILAQNTYTLQGTVELNYFNYFNTNNNWSNTANWSATSGGAGGASLPAAADNVIFDMNSGSNTIIDVPATVNNITLASTYKSGLINGGSNNVTSTGTSTLSGGFLIGVNDNLTVNNVTLSGTQFVATSGIITITGALTYVSGNFKPSNGTIAFASSAAQTIPPINFYNLTFDGTGTKTAGGNFSIAGNLVNKSTFFAAGNTVVFNGTIGQTISGTSTTKLNNVTISNASGSGLQLSAPLEITGVLTFMANSKLTTNGNLTLVATSPTVTASIAAFPSGANITGTVKVQKYIYSTLRIYRYLSSAVSGATVADWQTSIPITGTFANPSTGTGIVSTSPNMYVYDESVAGLQSLGYSAYPASGNSSSASLVVGKGYSVFVRNNAGRPNVLEVNGTINKGTLTIPVTYTSSGMSSDDGWNLVGNPYPSSINWSSVAAADRVNIGNAIYYQDNNSASPVYRSWVNGVGTNCSSGVISPAQGFWVKATGASPLLRFRESHKTSATPSFYRLSDELALLRIALDSTNSTFRDETVIRLSDDATADFDAEFDAYKLYDATHPAIGSSTNVSPLLSINAFTLEENSRDTISLFVKAVKEGNYTLSIPEYSFDASMTAYLLDGYTGTKQLILQDSKYSFNVSADSVSKTNRFKIILEKNTLTTGVFPSASKNGIVVFPNPVENNRSVTIRFAEALNKDVDISVYDLTGALVYSAYQVGASDQEYAVTFPSTLLSGLYNIHITTEDKSSSSSFIIK